jgi:regulator of protease activity HflC (stomatin/prohibitin superfamily)
MKNYLLLSVLFLSILLTSCHGVRPDAGEESVLIKKPWIFGHGGVEKNPVSTGNVWCVWSTSSETFNIKPVQLTEKFDDVITSDNVPVDFNAYISVQVQKGRTPLLYEEFGVEWYKNNVKEPFRTLLRNYSKKQKLFELTTDANILSEGEDFVFTEITKLIKEKNIPVDVIKVTIGRISPPADVTAETTQTAAQKQRSRTETERAVAELARAQAETNSAIADNAYRKEFGMTVPQYLHRLEILNELTAIEKTDNIQLIMNGAGAVPMIPLKGN